MGGGVPSNTTSTTTVNQSPWQNPTYQALMLGTKDNPGPVTNILRSNQGYMEAYNRMLGQGLTPADIINSGKYTPSTGSPGVAFQNQAPEPTQAAADGGLMSLQGYAPGGSTTKNLSPAQVAAVTKYNNLVAQGKEIPGALIDRLNTIEQRTGRNVSPYSDSGSAAVGNKNLQNAIAKAAGSGNYPKDITGTSPYASVAEAYPKSGAVNTYNTAQAATAKEEKSSAAQEAILEQSLGRTAGIRVNDKGEFESTNPLFNQVVQQLQDAQKLPDQFGQATEAYKTGIAGLGEAAKYRAKDVAAERADVTGYDPAMAQATGYQATSMAAPKDIAAQGYDAAQMQAASMKAAQANRSDIRDIEAQMAQVEKMRAEMMQAPTEANVKDYEAAQARLYQMQGPKSWTEAGTAQQYMSPYMQNVVDIQKRESMRDYAKQLNQLKSQAVGAKAYGGSRLAIEQAEAARNQAQRLGDIEAQGLQQAYQQGMGQFSAEQGMNLQANQANLQAAQQTTLANQAATNQQRQNYVNSALQAAMQAYGGQLTAAQQNQIAANAASQFNAQSQNQAYNNYVAQQLAAQQANQGMDWNTVNLNTSNQQAAALANAQFQQQAAQANQNAINQQRSQFVTQQLEAAKVNYGGQLTAAQQNQIAANAANQFNASNQQQINLANQASQNAAGQFNAQAQNQAGLQYAQQNLQGQMANQQAGLQANQQNIGALGQTLQGAQGLGALGASQAQTNLANIGALGQGASAYQNLMQQYFNTQSNNALNTMNLPSNLNAPVANMINAQGTTAGTTTTSGSGSPSTWMGRAKGGSVEAHKEWDKAKGGNTVKKGIASRGWA